MKAKFTLLAALLVAFFGASAQQPLNSSFDTWTSPATPDNWTTADGLFGIPLGLSFRDTADKVDGPASLKLVSDSIAPAPSAGVIPGLVSYGTAVYTPGPTPPAFFGLPFAFRPDTLFFSYKYATPGADTAGLQLVLTKNDTTTVLGLGVDLLPSANWISGFLPLTAYYSSAQTPDTLLIQFYASFSQNVAPVKGSTLKVDKLRFGYVNQPTSITETTEAIKAVVFPNPAANSLNINSVEDLAGANLEVVSVEGKVVLAAALNGQMNTVNISELANGNYIYRIVGNGKTLHTSRLTVAK